MSRAKKVDANQGEIVSLLRQLGAKVCITSAVGGGFPDLVVQHRGRTMLVEIKDGSLPPSRRQLTKDQQVFHSIFDCEIVESEEDVMRLLSTAQ